MTRKGSNGEIPEGVKKVEIDYDDEDSLVQALTGQEFLIITLGVTAPASLHGKIAAAAGKAKVPYVMPNFYGYPISNHSDKDAYLKTTKDRLAEITDNGFSTEIHISCGFWYEWSLALGNQWFGIDIARRKATFFDDGKRPITVSTWDQCGNAIAALLSLPQRGASPSLADFAGPDRGVNIESWHVSQRDMLDSVHRVLGTTDADWEIAYEPVEKRIRDGQEELSKGDHRGFAKMLYGGIFDASNPVSNYVGEANAVLGLPKEDLDQATKRAVDMALGGYNPLGDNVKLPHLQGKKIE